MTRRFLVVIGVTSRADPAMGSGRLYPFAQRPLPGVTPMACIARIAVHRRTLNQTLINIDQKIEEARAARP